MHLAHQPVLLQSHKLLVCSNQCLGLFASTYNNIRVTRRLATANRSHVSIHGRRCENIIFLTCGLITIQILLLPAGLPKSNVPVLNLLTGRKSGPSPHRGDSLHRFVRNLAWLTGTWVRLSGQIPPQSLRGGNPAPKYQTFPLLVKDRRPCPIYKSSMGFYVYHYYAKEFQI